MVVPSSVSHFNKKKKTTVVEKYFLANWNKELKSAAIQNKMIV